MSFKGFVKKYGGYNHYTNNAYLQYERVTGIEIIKRDIDGNPLALNNGLFSLHSEFISGTGSYAIDAFRHGFTSAIVSRDFSTSLSHAMGDALEAFSNSSVLEPNEAKKDFANNAFGRPYGEPGLADDQIADLIYLDGIIGGGLIINPSKASDYINASFWDVYGPVDPVYDFGARMLTHASIASSIAIGNIGSVMNTVIADLKGTLFISQNHVSPLVTVNKLPRNV